MPDLHLPDVSEFQGNVDWPRVVGKNGGAGIIRVSTGFRLDHMWPVRRTAAEVAGVRALGLYQYLVPSRPAAVQAHEFCDAVLTLKPGEFAMLDFEDRGFPVRDVSGVADEWLSIVDGRLSYPGYRGSWLYADGDFVRTRGLSRLFASPRPTVLAAYSRSEPPVPGHSLWQHTSSGCIWLDGTVTQTSGCDCNVYHGDVGGLLTRICGGTPFEPSQPQPGNNRFAGFRRIGLGDLDPIHDAPLPNVPYDPHDYPVHALQYSFNALTGRPGFLKWDGRYGAATAGVVADFQRFWHLGVDGVCGPATWAQLDVVADMKGM